MPILKIAGCLLTLLLLTSGCVTQPQLKTFSDYDEGTKFTDYRSFAWMTQNPLFVASMQPVNPSLQQSLMRETSAQLKARGFSQVSRPEDADFVVSFTVGSRDNLQVNNYPSKYRQIATVGQSYPETSEVREVTTGKVVMSTDKLPNYLAGVAFHPEGKLDAVTGDPILVWDQTLPGVWYHTGHAAIFCIEITRGRQAPTAHGLALELFLIAMLGKRL